MILYREGQIRSMQFAAFLLEPRKSVVGVQFVQDMAIDIDQIAAVRTLPDAMKIPDFVEQAARHGVRI
jgi:hypothetical protein